MGRTRKTRLELPRRMYCDRGVYYFWPLGKPKIWFRDEQRRPLSLAAALAAYGLLVDRHLEVDTVADLVDEYSKSAEFASLAERTQADRLVYLADLRKVFGHYGVRELRAGDILEWKTAKAAKAPRQWNQRLSMLKILMRYAADPLGLVEARDDPTAGIRRMREAPRTRLPTMAEIETFLAGQPEQLRLYVGLKLLTGLRMGDLLRLERRMILDDCLRTPIGKARRRERVMRFLFVDPVTGESTGVRELLDDVLALPQKVGSALLFRTRKGRAYTMSGWKSMWQRRMAKFVGAGGERFHEHDIRATAGHAVEESQGREAARRLLDHVDQRTTAGYTGRGDASVVPLRRGK